MTHTCPAVTADACADTLALILAGGSGTRLQGLTASRAKPAVPFGGHYRAVDFTLSNCVNSGIRHVALLTQYESELLVRHVHLGWRARDDLGARVEVWPAQQRATRVYSGTADAVYQNADRVALLDPEYVLVLAGDHVYSMNYARILEDHLTRGADLTVSCVEVPLEDARGYGIVELGRNNRVQGFVEKPDRARPVRAGSRHVVASMGVYLFSRQFLLDNLEADSRDRSSKHDFGHDILPRAIRQGRVYAHAFRDPTSGARAYWRDIGTLDHYWAAHMDLLREPAEFDPFAPDWPIWTPELCGPPARISRTARVGATIVARGCELAGHVTESVLSAGCRVGPRSSVHASVLLPNVVVGRSCRLDRVVIDSGCVVPDHTVISPADLPFDFHVSSRGVVLVTADQLAAAEQTSTKVA